jgi:hypothetical protein
MNKENTNPCKDIKIPVRMVDPPGGWKYGFPAPLRANYEKQLRESGYPEKDIPFALENSRYWFYEE